MSRLAIINTYIQVTDEGFPPFRKKHMKRNMEFTKGKRLFSGIQKWSNRKLSNRAGSSM